MCDDRRLALHQPTGQLADVGPFVVQARLGRSSHLRLECGVHAP